MITKEEYLAALQIVLEYHHQIQIDIDVADTIMNPKDERTISWFLENVGTACSRRLRDILKMQSEWYDDIPIKEYSKLDFIKMKGAGKGSWNEFERLRNSLLYP
jgi:hypothetical protein